MTLLHICVGLLPSAACGWMLLRVLEWKNPVLTQLERITLGIVLGITASMFVVFLLHVTVGMPLTLWGFLLSFTILFLPLLGIYARWLRGTSISTPRLPPSSRGARWAAIGLAVLGLWVMIRVIASTVVLFTTPTFYDDTMDNWNLRGKVFYHTQRIELTLPPDAEPGGISSYPPTVPLFKTWLATLAAGWDESTVNGVHAIWYVCSLILVYCAIRRRAGMFWALLGTYILASLPLFLMQGLNAYADVYLAAHLLAAVVLLLSLAEATTRMLAMTIVRMLAFALGLLTFAKNEGLALYLPILLAVTGVCLWQLLRKGILRKIDVMHAALWIGGVLLVIAGPWIVFKRMHNLVFGNAHSLSTFSFSWHGDVPLALVINTFFEGNWLLFFPLLAVLLIFRWRHAFRSPLVAATLFFLLAYGLQIFLYLFTSLASEAIRQTGYARGVVQIIPVAVIVGTLLLKEFLTGNSRDQSPAFGPEGLRP